jgi:hypothetical protein
VKAKYLKLILPLIAATAFCGCGTPYNYSPYVGEQKNWITTPGSYVRVVDKATIYSAGQYPNRPYVIIGAVSTDNEENLAKAVHEKHADAALIYNQYSVRDGAVAVAAPGVYWAEPLRRTVITANLILYKP